MRGHRRHADGEDDQRVRRTEHRDHEQGEDDLREGEDDVHRPHQHVVELAPVVGGEQADDRADHEREQRGEECRDQDRAAAVQEPRPDVATELAGTEQRVLLELAGGLHRHADALVLAVRREVATEEGESTSSVVMIRPTRVRHIRSATRKMPGGFAATTARLAVDR